MTAKKYTLNQFLTDSDVEDVLRQAVTEDCELICSEVKPATDGLAGYLGDHVKAVLHVKVKDAIRKVHLFMKSLPMDNKEKAVFIDRNNFFKREKMVYGLMNNLEGIEGPNPWGVKAYICTDSIVVLPDLSVEGYSVHPLLETLDLPHVLTAITSIARYHAAFANYEAKGTSNGMKMKNFYREHKDLLMEVTFKDTPFIRTAAKLTANFLEEFSTKYSKIVIPDLEFKLTMLYIDACKALDIGKDTVNVLAHRDTWNNNILFKYDKGNPTNAILIDYQCVNYVPPAVDIMILLYTTTSRKFRDQYESRVFRYYFEVFKRSLADETAKNVQMLKYDEKEFVLWCEKLRLFGLFYALAISPIILMDPKSGEETFSNPDTFELIYEQDRSGPIIEYATKHTIYRERQLELSEEFVQRFIFKSS